jgi:hypothetical protein
MEKTNTGITSDTTDFPHDTADFLHHVGLINANLQISAACYERLGFTLTPVSLPRIALRQDGPPELLGAGNRHAIFAKNYLELLGIVDPQRWESIPKESIGPYNLEIPLSRYEGLHVMHFGTEHIEELKRRLDRQGISCSSVKVFQRNVQTPNGEQMMKAKTISFPLEENPEGLLQVAQHDTPELVFQSRYMQHPNGALALTEIIIVALQPKTYAEKYQRFSGHLSERIADDHYVVDLGHSRIIVIGPERLGTMLPGRWQLPLPFMAAFTVEVADLANVRKELSKNEVPYIERADTVIVAPEHAGGCAVIFRIGHLG